MITPGEAKARWQGSVIPLVTPFQQNGELDLASLRENVRWLLDRGARLGNTVFLVAGSGGDFTVMSLEERLLVIRAVAEVTDGRVPIIAGAQSTDLRDCVAIAQLCADLSLDAIQISAPYFYDVRYDDALAWIKEIAHKAKVGFAIYNHYYSGSKFDVPIELVEQLLKIENSVGVKWASPDIEKYYAGLRRFLPHVTVVDNMFLPVESHLRGCKAYVSHIPNFCPEFMWRIWELMEAGRYVEAQGLHDSIMVPYSLLVGQIMSATAGEGVFVRPFMTAAGLKGGHSRLPSRDIVLTREIRDQVNELVVLTQTLSQSATLDR